MAEHTPQEIRRNLREATQILKQLAEWGMMPKAEAKRMQKAIRERAAEMIRQSSGRKKSGP